MSIFALEPPVLTTETTCVALPTEFANQGVAAPLTGANARNAPARQAAAHSEASSRRMDSIVRCAKPHGQVKLQIRLGNFAVTTGASSAGAPGAGRNTNRQKRK